MSNVRLRRLAADFERMQSYVRRHPRVKLLQVEGSPPEKYQLQYVVRSLRQIGGEIREADSHTVEIVLPRNYPRTPPQCRMLTPVFHPNVAPHAICVGDHWGAGEPLESIVVRIGEMLAYQSYNVKSPLNGDAARWVEQNLHRIPTDKVSMLAEETAADPAAGPAPSGYPTAAYPAAAPAAPAAPVADVYRVEAAPPQHYPQQPYPQQPAYPQQPYAQQPYPQQPYQQPPQYPQQPAYPQQPYAQQPYPQPPYQQQPYPQQAAYPQPSGYPQQGVQPPGGIPPMSQPPAPPQPAAAQQPSSAGTAPQAADRIKVSCPGCGKTYVVPASNRGRTAKCQNCQHSFTL